jgi:hypothetical protein
LLFFKEKILKDYIRISYNPFCTKKFKNKEILLYTMLELSIPQLNEESKNTKDIVFTILTKEHPLSIIEITNRIKKQYNLSITYQAVRKAIDNLHGQGVLNKEGKKYSIDKKWILKLKSFFDQLLTKFETGKHIHKFNNELVKENYAVYTFNNLLDLDNFWSDIMVYWADHLKATDNKVYLSNTHYFFWHIINLGMETKLFDHMKKKKVKLYTVCQKDNPLNRWGTRLYKEQGVKIKLKHNNNLNSRDLNILGDMIVQIEYSKKISKKITNFYAKYQKLEDISLKEITKLAHEEGEIKFILFKNPELAKDLLEKYLKDLK